MIEDTSRVEKVIDDFISSKALVPAGMFLSRWMVVGVAQDPEKPWRNCYFRIYPNGYMAQHEAVGLLELGISHVMEAAEQEEDDDETA